jgi:hypothetical protein
MSVTHTHINANIDRIIAGIENKKKNFFHIYAESV